MLESVEMADDKCKLMEAGAASNRPQWGVSVPTLKYMSQSEKDPRFLQRRRQKQRRKQRILAEKQLHGSWPSSENSGYYSPSLLSTLGLLGFFFEV